MGKNGIVLMYYIVLYPAILSMIWCPFLILPPFWGFAARIQFKAKVANSVLRSTHPHIKKNQTHKAIISEAPETRSRSASLRQKWFWWRVWAISNSRLSTDFLKATMWRGEEAWFDFAFNQQSHGEWYRVIYDVLPTLKPSQYFHVYPCISVPNPS